MSNWKIKTMLRESAGSQSKAALADASSVASSAKLHRGNVSGADHDYSRKTLFTHLDQIAHEFPAAVQQRGLNRNWNKYRFVLSQISNLSELLPQSGGNYLDLGSGAGIVPLVMAKAGLRVSVIDTWTEYADELDNLMGSFAQFSARFDKYKVNWTKRDITQTPLPFAPHSYDMISLFDVLEHLPRPRKVLMEVERLLRPGGIVFVTLPNVANLRNRIRLLFGQSPHPDPIESWFDPAFFGHYREMTMHEVTETFSSCNFSVVQAKYSSSCHWNTRLSDGRWGRQYLLNSIHQLEKLLYLGVTAVVPSFRYELFVAALKR